MLVAVRLLARNAMLGDKVIQDNNAAFDDAPLWAG